MAEELNSAHEAVHETAVSPSPETSAAQLDAEAAAALARRDEAARLAGNAIHELEGFNAKVEEAKKLLANELAVLAATKRDVAVELEAFAKAQADVKAARAAIDAAVGEKAAAEEALADLEGKAAAVQASYDKKDADLKAREAALIEARVALEAEKADVAKIKAIFK